MKKATIAYVPSSHLDLFWLGNYKTCLERGSEVIRQFLERCLETGDETFLLETAVFAEDFLRRHPEWRDDFVALVKAGRLEVGSAYVDRWETLVPAESLIRNVKLGRQWARETLGIENAVVTHPDLPSMTPQISQIYRQLGVKYYVTSRKVFREGQVWRYQSPDGSHMLVLNWPKHYVFTLMSPSDVAEDFLPRIWAPPLDIEKTLQGFPLKTVVVAGSAGDLAGRETFVERYSKGLEDFVGEYRERYPDYDFTYTIPSLALAGYESESLPVLSGSIPSVWGVAADEETTFFQRDRAYEARLLTAESMAALANHLGLSWVPEAVDRWKGTFDEAAFFARKDPIPSEKLFEELWRMHVFTQDHNGGGQEGALSTFQKRVIQVRGLEYCQQIIRKVFGEIASGLAGSGEQLLVFNPHGQAWNGPLAVDVPQGMAAVGEDGQALPMQGADVLVPDVPPLGYRAFRLAPQAAAPAQPAAQIVREAGQLRVANAFMDVTVDLNTGNVTRLGEWGKIALGDLYSLTESGNDVTMRMADTPPVFANLKSVEVLSSGALYTRLRVCKELLHCHVEQTYTVWNHEPRLDLETRIFWWGKHSQQVRMTLGNAAASQVTYGAPFYGVGWTDVVEGTRPANPDELLPEDQLAYREVLGWLHLRRESHGLAIFSQHPAFYQQDGAVEAVLLRTSPSCGDGRLFFENAGEQVFTFTFAPCAADWRAANVQKLAGRILHAPVASIGAASAAGQLPAHFSLAHVENAWALVSACYPGSQPGETVLRVWEAQGQGGKLKVSGPLAGQTVAAVDLMDEPSGAPDPFDAPAWSIRTLLFRIGK